MKSNKLLLPVIALLVGASIASTLTFTLTRDSKSASSEPSYLFVYEGKNAELTPIGDSETEFTLTVPIASEDAKVAWFTDRPYRDAGHITYSELANKFTTNEEDSFKADPPNVAIQIEDKTLIAKMTVPKIIPWLNGGKAFAANFVLVPQKDHKDLISEESFLSQHITRNTQDQHGGAQTLKEVSVFIDNASATVYRVGDTGPGGGTIFYVAPEPFWCGPTRSQTCTYLEAAPSGWNTGSDPTKAWAVAAYTGADVSGVGNDNLYNNALGVGLGYKNSLAIVTQNGAGTTYAAGAARAYTGGSKTDWYLPTTAELNLLCQWNRGLAPNVTFGPVSSYGGSINSATYGAGAAGFLPGAYWSSSEQASTVAWSQYFDDGFQGNNWKRSTTTYVRPIRAF